MCLIAHRPVGKRGRGANIPTDVIDFNLKSNPHGFGIAWRDPELGLTYSKFGKDQGSQFRALLKSIDSNKKIEYVAHWRWATQGAICADMSHPFEYVDPAGERVLLFHNGVITIDSLPGESDTAAFVRKIASKMPPRWWHEPGLVELVSDYIDWSRLAIMTEGETVYVNGPREKWVPEGGMFYSTEPRGYTYWKDEEDWKDTKDTKEEDEMVWGWRGADRGGFDPDAEIDIHTIWAHMGHNVRVHSVDSDPRFQDEPWGGVACVECGMSGQFYIWSHKLYIDIQHYDLYENADGEVREVPVGPAKAIVLAS